MLFNSFEFLVFIPIVLLGHAMLRGRPLRVWLLILSYIFYGWGHPLWYTALLFYSTVLNYVCSNRIAAARSPRTRKAWLIASLAGDLTVLGIFKYLAYFTVVANKASGFLHLGVDFPVASLPLPVGISFYTFQTMAYAIDVYRGTIPPSKSFINMALYVAFFPQLVAGPIERAGNLLRQIAEKQSRTVDDVLRGFTRVLWGLVKKVAFADWLGIVVNQVYNDPGRMTSWDLLLATYGFAFQIYLDFSAYSDIAIGIARTMGIDLIENFRSPYLSRNVAEYWSRWHISLSTWLRDYLYFPLGGSRKGVYRTILNVFIVMFLGGLWHGASTTFIMWGLWTGLGIALYHVYRVLVLGGRKDDMERPLAWSDAVPIFLTFHWMLLSRVFFRAVDGSDALHILKRFFTGPWGWPAFSIDPQDVVRTLILIGIAFTASLIRRLGWRLPRVDTHSPVAVGAVWGLLAVIVLLMFAPVQDQFIYFQF